MRRVWIISAGLFLVAFAVFSRVLLADFVQWDDDISVSQNPHVQGLDWGRLEWMFTDASYAMRYKPLTWLTYAVIHQVAGLRPVAYHLMNLLFHSLNAVMIFLVFRRLLVVCAGAGDGKGVQVVPNAVERASSQKLVTSSPTIKATLPAALAALLWAVQPLRVEPVARVTDLTYCMVVLFLMISLWCYLEANEAEGRGEKGERRRAVYFGCSVATYAVAMLFYPFVFGWAVVLLVVDWYPLGRFEGRGSRGERGKTLYALRSTLLTLLREKIPFLLCGALVLMTLLARQNPSVVWANPQDDFALSGFARLMQAFYIWGYYIWRPWAPIHLSPVYTTLIQFNPNNWIFWWSALGVVGLTLFVAANRKRWPWALALWVSYLILLLPALGLTEHPHYSSDRYDYVPGLIWALAIAGILWKFSERPKLMAVGTACALLVAIVWAGISFHQTRIWRNSLAIFEYMVQELGDDPGRSDLRRRLGGFYAREGRVDDAIRQYQDAVRLKPMARNYQALAEYLEKQGNADGALTNYLAWSRVESDPLIHLRAAAQLKELGRTQEAVEQYRKALELRPGFQPAKEQLDKIMSGNAKTNIERSRPSGRATNFQR